MQHDKQAPDQAGSDARAPSPGKLVGGARYIHVDALPWLLRQEQEQVARAETLAQINRADWNVAKLQMSRERISLMRYERFFADPFPPLAKAWSIDLGGETVRVSRHDPDGNPPILHRKELLLPPEHPDLACFAALTKELEERGLFCDSSKIGHRKAWWARLDAAGITLQGHRVMTTDHDSASRERGTEPPPDVHRHKTAISRPNLSGPMQALARHGFLEGDRSVFDYGCGRGDDVTVLQAAGLSAHGWDPHYAADAPLHEADIVNLGFVLNVIEDPQERKKALREAFALARQAMCVAVLTVGRSGDVSSLTPYRDGFLTSRNTFQKYFTQEEAQDLIAEVTGEEAIPVAPGVFFAFRDKIEEQRFLESRSRRRRDISHLLAITPPPAAPKQTKTDALIEAHRSTIEAVWTRSLELGRVPVSEELDHTTQEALERASLSVRKTLQLAQRIADPASLTRAREMRSADLRVYFALNLFNQRRRYRELPAELQRDVKAFFSAHSQAETAGRELLFSISDPETILTACREAADAGLGHLFEGHSLQLHAELIPRLPEVLRIYVGCAEKLFGAIDAETADLIKIHAQSGKLTLLRFDDFYGKALPRLVERVKIKMRDRDIDFFDYEQDNAAPRLTMKSRYIASDQEEYERQRAFDSELEGLGIFDFEGYGPSAAELARGVSNAGYQVVGFSLVRKDASRAS